jgi:hypothetical protein
VSTVAGASKDVNTEAEEATELEAVTRHAVVNCRVCELVIALDLLVVTISKCLINPKPLLQV